MGLLYYGQNFLIYPSAFPAGARESELLSPLSRSRLSSLTSAPDVPVPTDFSIPYTDLELTTSDKIKIRAFLLLQRTVLNMGETPVEGSPSDEEVRSNAFLGNHPLGCLFISSLRFRSLRRRGQRCSCSTATVGTTGTVSHWARSSLERCAATSSCSHIAGTCSSSLSPPLLLPPLTFFCSYGHSEGTPSENGA